MHSQEQMSLISSFVIFLYIFSVIACVYVREIFLYGDQCVRINWWIELIRNGMIVEEVRIIIQILDRVSLWGKKTVSRSFRHLLGRGVD